MRRAWKVTGAFVLACAWIATLAETPASAAGRWKKQGDTCVWDAKDGGPDRCTPKPQSR